MQKSFEHNLSKFVRNLHLLFTFYSECAKTESVLELPTYSPNIHVKIHLHKINKDRVFTRYYASRHFRRQNCIRSKMESMSTSTCKNLLRIETVKNIFPHLT